MRRSFFQRSIIILFCFLYSSGFSQDIQSFSATVIDSTTQQPLSGATIVLKDTSEKIYHEITNESGIFTFSSLKMGKYKLTIKHIGYKTYKDDLLWLDKTLAEKKLTIIIARSDETLESITVIKPKLYIKQTIDKITLNVDASPIAAGSSAYELLLSAPGVMEQNSNIQFRGKSVNVLINGRQSNLSGDDLKTFLSAIPAIGIEKIELIPNPSSKYDAQGGSVINVIVAKNKNYGTNGTITTGTGLNRYGTYNGAINMNYRNSAMNIYGGYNYEYKTRYFKNTSNRVISPGMDIIENEYDVRYQNNHTGKIGLDYDLNKKTSIGFLANGYLLTRDRKVLNTSVLDYKANLNDSFSTLTNIGYARIVTPSVNLYYKTNFNNGKELTFNANYFNYNKKWDDQFVTRSYKPDSTEYLPPSLLRDNSPADNTVKTFTADYEQPTKTGNWEAGLKAAISKTDNNVLWEYESGGNWKTDLGKTNHFIYNEKIYAAYINYRRQVKKITFQTGLRMEHTKAKGESITLDTIISRNYTSLFPNVGVQIIQSEKSQFGITYRKSIQRFGYEIVNPFIVYQSQYSYYQGNPNIKPIIMHSIEISHSWKYQLFTALGYTYMKDAINIVYRQDNESRLLINSFDNLSSAQIFTGTVTWSKMFLEGKLTTTNTAGAFYIKYQSSEKDVELDNAKLTGYFNTNNMLRLKKGYSAELSGYYYSPMVSGVYDQKSFYNVSAGFSKEILKRKGNLKLSITDIFNTQVRRYNVNYQNINSSMRQKAESRIVNMVFTYKFGNGKVKEPGKRKTGMEDEKERMK